MQKRVAILVADGFTDSGLSVALDVFRAANVLAARKAKAPQFRVDVVSAQGGRVVAASGMALEATRAMATARLADLVLVPGVWVEDAIQVDAVLARADIGRLVRTIATCHRRGAVIGGSCGGTFLLAEAGLLDGHEATTAWWLAPHMQQRYPKVRVNAERALVVRKDVLCAGALFAQADLALHLVARFVGPLAARQCAAVLLLDTHQSQTPQMALHHLMANDPTVRSAEKWARAHLAEPFDIAALARHVGASPRTFARRLQAALGISPIGFVQQLRVATAVHLLETTRLSLQEISTRVGYSDTSTLRRLIARETSASPSSFRRKHQASAPRLRALASYAPTAR